MESRIHSIDIFRGLTMFLMIWVNDFWSLTDIPSWLEHAPGEADALGFSDTIFPAFLFIVGLSIPFALNSRRAKGSRNSEIIVHILSRSFALLVMGFLMVNLESYHSPTALIPRQAWQVAMIFSFFLIWNRYPSGDNWAKAQLAFKAIGWIVLLGLAFCFRSDPESGYNWLEPHWWGILGLIGWSYLVCSLLNLAIGNRPLLNAMAWISFSLFNIASFAGWLSFLSPVQPYIWLVGDGSLPALTMSGCFVSTLYLHYSNQGTSRRFIIATAVLGITCIAAGLALRPYWGISKIQATPAWTEVCTGLSMISFSVIFWIADIRGWKNWANVFKPAGVATLTCYLIPYLAYPLLNVIGIEMPTTLTSGVLGLLSSMMFAVAIIFTTGLITKVGVKLKI